MNDALSRQKGATDRALRELELARARVVSPTPTTTPNPHPNPTPNPNPALNPNPNPNPNQAPRDQLAAPPPRNSSIDAKPEEWVGDFSSIFKGPPVA